MIPEPGEHRGATPGPAWEAAGAFVAAPPAGDSPARTDAEPPLEWSDNPWRRNLMGSLLGLSMTLAVIALAWGSGAMPMTLIAVLAAFMVTMSPGFLPTRYRVDARGVARRVWFVWHRHDWESLRRAVVRHTPPFSPHIWLSTLERPGPREPIRGLSLGVPRYQPGHEQLFRELRRRLALHGL
ncbi:MAG TPA: hypothetical protein VI792_03580 [Candidatus Eisenbacteria bacterium]